LENDGKANQTCEPLRTLSLQQDVDDPLELHEIDL